MESKIITSVKENLRKRIKDEFSTKDYNNQFIQLLDNSSIEKVLSDDIIQLNENYFSLLFSSLGGKTSSLLDGGINVYSHTKTTSQYSGLVNLLPKNSLVITTGCGCYGGLKNLVNAHNNYDRLITTYDTIKDHSNKLKQSLGDNINISLDGISGAVKNEEGGTAFKSVINLGKIIWSVDRLKDKSLDQLLVLDNSTSDIKDVNALYSLIQNNNLEDVPYVNGKADGRGDSCNINQYYVGALKILFPKREITYIRSVDNVPLNAESRFPGERYEILVF